MTVYLSSTGVGILPSIPAGRRSCFAVFVVAQVRVLCGPKSGTRDLLLFARVFKTQIPFVKFVTDFNVVLYGTQCKYCLNFNCIFIMSRWFGKWKTGIQIYISVKMTQTHTNGRGRGFSRCARKWCQIISKTVRPNPINMVPVLFSHWKLETGNGLSNGIGFEAI